MACFICFLGETGKSVSVFSSGRWPDKILVEPLTVKLCLEDTMPAGAYLMTKNLLYIAILLQVSCCLNLGMAEITQKSKSGIVYELVSKNSKNSKQKFYLKEMRPSELVFSSILKSKAYKSLPAKEKRFINILLSQNSLFVDFSSVQANLEKLDNRFDDKYHAMDYLTVLKSRNPGLEKLVYGHTEGFYLKPQNSLFYRFSDILVSSNGMLYPKIPDEIESDKALTKHFLATKEKSLVKLAPLELNLFLFLFFQEGKIIQRDELISCLWGSKYFKKNGDLIEDQIQKYQSHLSLVYSKLRSHLGARKRHLHTVLSGGTGLLDKQILYQNQDFFDVGSLRFYPNLRSVVLRPTLESTDPYKWSHFRLAHYAVLERMCKNPNNTYDGTTFEDRDLKLIPRSNFRVYKTEINKQLKKDFGFKVLKYDSYKGYFCCPPSLL